MEQYVTVKDNKILYLSNVGQES